MRVTVPTVPSGFFQLVTYTFSAYAARSTSATSGRVNSAGRFSPARSFSRTFVPLSTRWWLLSCGQVRGLTS